ncbi:MAG: hypothetical protein M1818_006788 [Claussenomyces sp. TS43310]|nr:MAG: hypothetical protein M1818_006788 [Claussenomyces sp. TS43310]
MKAHPALWFLEGETGHSSWDYTVLKECISFYDMHSIHIYTCSNEHLPNVTAPLSAERAIEVASGLIDLARIENNIPSSVKRTTICLDEWNVWDPVRAPGEKGAEELYTLSDALAVAYVCMANIAQSVNVISPLMTTPDGIVKQATGWPLLLFSRYMRGWTVGCHPSINEEGVMSMVVGNINDEKDFDVDLKGVGGAGEVAVYTVTGDTVKAINITKEEQVSLKEGRWDGRGKVHFQETLHDHVTVGHGRKGRRGVEGRGIRNSQTAAALKSCANSIPRNFSDTDVWGGGKGYLPMNYMME